MSGLLDRFQREYRILNSGPNRIAMGKPPRTVISDALVDQFCDLVECLNPEAVLEIGAHEGAFSQEMRRRLPDATIWAFEANPHVYEKYKGRFGASSGGVQYQWRAISDSDDELELFIPTSIQGLGRPLDNRMGSLNHLANATAEGTVVHVPGSTLDGILGEHLGKALALWIDVEGAVDRVLGGAQAAMATAQAVMCEVESASVWSNQAKDAEILAQFRRFGLVPILCDCQSPVQYNVILVQERDVDTPAIQMMVKKFADKVEEVLSAHARATGA